MSGSIAAGLPRPGDYQARLDKKTGRRVLCGYPQCRGEYGYVNELKHVGGAWTLRQLVMPPGWLPDGAGIWRLTRHAQRFVDLDEAEYARLLGLSEPKGRQAPRNRRGYTHASRPDAYSPPDLTPIHAGAGILRFPIVAICPKCHHRNVLTAAALGVVDEGEYARLLGLSAPQR